MNRPYRDRSAAGLHTASMPNMTPMVDVVMVILVFFMATASVMGPEWLLKTALPGKSSAKAAPAETTPVRLTITPGQGAAQILVVVGAAGNNARREVQTSLSDLPALLQTLATERGADNLAVSFDASDDVPYEAVVKAHEACQRAGISRVGVPSR